MFIIQNVFDQQKQEIESLNTFVLHLQKHIIEMKQENRYVLANLVDCEQ